MSKEQLQKLPDFMELLMRISSRRTVAEKLVDLDLFLVRPREDQPGRIEIVEYLHELGAIAFADIAAFCRAGEETEAPRPRGIAKPGGSKCESPYLPFRGLGLPILAADGVCLSLVCQSQLGRRSKFVRP